MRKIVAGGAGLLMLVLGQVHADEIICPAVSDIRRNIESVEDVYFVDLPDDRDWKSVSLVDVVDPPSLKFEGAEYEIHEADGDKQALATATITCRYGEINLTQKRIQILEPSFSRWVDNRCASPDPKMCTLISADYFNLSF